MRAFHPRKSLKSRQFLLMMCLISISGTQTSPSVKQSHQQAGHCSLSPGLEREKLSPSCKEPYFSSRRNESAQKILCSQLSPTKPQTRLLRESRRSFHAAIFRLTRAQCIRGHSTRYVRGFSRSMQTSQGGARISVCLMISAMLMRLCRT